MMPPHNTIATFKTKDWLHVAAVVALIFVLLPWIAKGSYEVIIYVVKNYYMWVFKL